MIGYKLRLRQTNTYTKIFSLTVFLGAVLALSLCLLLNIGEYRIVAFIPFSYFLLFFLSTNNRIYLNNISLSIINIVAFCRYIIYPIIIAINIHTGGFYSFDSRIVGIFVYEMFGVFLTISLSAKMLDTPVNHTDFNTLVHLGLPNTLLMLSIIPIIIFFPTLITRFSVSQDAIKTTVASGLIEVPFTMGIWVLFVSLLVSLSPSQTRSKLLRTLGFVLAVAISVYYILFNAISGTDIKRWQIISCGIAIIYIVLKLFPEKKRVILISGTLGIIVSVFVGSFIKFGVSISFGNFVSKYLDLYHFTEYFGGMKNVTTAINLFKNTPNAQGITSTLTDFFSGVPVLSALFDYDTFSTPAIFQRFTHRNDIICPLTAQSIAHFGYFGTPVLAMIMTFLSITFNRALKKSNNLFSMYVLIELMVFFSLFMALNTTILFGKLWIRLMFLIIQPIDAKMRFKVTLRGNK